MTDDRFGPNGAVMDGMSDEMRAEYERGAQLSLRGIRSLAVQAVCLAPLVLGYQALIRAAWYEPPDWAWLALMSATSLALMLLAVGPLFRARREAFQTTAAGLPFGVLIALAAEAFVQYRTADAASLLP